ncbi:MAG: DEAD/DEAH box helicase [Actinobacteria bacterium]|nr:DEAD/DEAH box helicase [Actinomycetota bacterium]MBI3687794.1 DEAD/DEAH box helicase [Actinomycetota bacterium]
MHSDNPTFAELGTHPQIVEALAAVGITRAFAIQELTLPLAIAGHDVIGQARTGTGKTLGFGIPLLQRLATPQAGTPRALIVAPTRELAVQVTHDLATAGSRLGLRCLSIYGGRAYEPQVTALRQGVDVVVGTPGRLLDLREQGHLKLDRIEVLVLDEADEMLDLGFLPDIEKLISLVPADRQTLLFSATMPGPIVALARRFLRQPTQVRAESHDEHPGIIPPAVAQFAYRAHAMDKVEMLARILQARGRGLTMIFCRTKRTAAKIADDLAGRGFAAAAVHGDLGQGAREQALRAFRKGKVDVLVATDVAARGIDIEAVTHVINYQCPEDEKVYVHRIGRTARAGATGTAVTFVDWDELPRWKIICDVLELPLHEPPETYSTSAHLHIDLDIGENISGVLPAAQRVRAGLDAEDVEDLGETGRGRRGPKPAARHRPERHGPERHGRRSMRSTEPARAAGQSAEQLADEADLPAANERAPRPPGTRRRTRRGRPTERDLVGATGTATALAEAPSAAAAGDTPGAAGGNESSGGAVRRRRRGRAAPSGG